jgi:dolichol-phosphate mannosyltransferase
VSVVVPTYNEVLNLPILLGRLQAALADLDYEIIVVDDDSPDRTWEVADRWAANTNRIRVLRRIGRRGLSSAVLDGMAMAAGRVLAVIDADLQHDEAVLHEIITTVLEGDADVCLGSRDAPGGSYGPFGPLRRLLSWSGAQVAHRLLGVAVSDPMSGYFAVSAERFEAVRDTVNPRGFKILLELLARGPRPRVVEVGYRFRARASGETKLTSSVAVAYLAAVLDLTFGRLASSAFVTYTAVAVFGISLRLVLGSLALILALPALIEVAAFEAAVGAEFAAHNRFTFAARAQRGWRQLGPLLRFNLVAAHSLLVHAGTASVIENRLADPLAPPPGAILLAVAAAGVGIAVVASYGLNIVLTWPGDGERGVAGP